MHRGSAKGKKHILAWGPMTTGNPSFISEGHKDVPDLDNVTLKIQREEIQSKI